MALLDRFRRPAPGKGTQSKHESGRGHTGGFLRYDEINSKLVGTQGIRKFAEMFRSDADVRKALIMLWAPIASATWEIEAAGAADDSTTEEDEEIRDFVEWALMERMTPRWSAHLWEIGRVGGRAGFVPFEIIFGKDEWKRVKPKPPTEVKVDPEDPMQPPDVQPPDDQPPEFTSKQVVCCDSLALRLPESIFRWEQDGPHLTRIWQYAQGVEGEVPLEFENVVYYRFGAEGDNWEGESLLRGAYKPWKYKDTLELIDAIAHEKYRIGVPIVYPPAGGGGDQLEDAVDAISNIRSNEQSYIAAPGPKQGAGVEPGSGWLFEILQPQGSSEGASVVESLKYHKDAIAASVIEEFMRLGQENVGARATADVQQDPFYLYCSALAETCVADPVNEQLIPRLVGLNYKTDRMPKLKASLIDSTSLEALASYVSTLSTIITPDDDLEDHLRERADLPPADPVARAEAKAQADLAQKQAVETHKAGLENPAAAPAPKPGAGAKGPPALKVLDAGAPDVHDHMDLAATEARLDAARGEVERLTQKYAKTLAAGQTPPDYLDAITEHFEATEAFGAASVARELESQRDDPVLLDQKFERLHPRDGRGRFSKASGPAGSSFANAIDCGSDVERAAALIAEGKHVRLDETRHVGTLLGELRKIVDDAREKGAKAPVYDLCKVQVRRTNLFCIESKGIPRVKMPQLAGPPIKGSKGESLPKNSKGFIDVSAKFREHLIAKGHSVTATDERASYLKASQSELNGGKVAGIMGAIQSGKIQPGTGDRIFTSRDNYIVDGHHRWAAQVGLDTLDGELGDVTMPIDRIDMPIVELLAEANAFAEEWGIPQAAV